MQQLLTKVKVLAGTAKFDQMLYLKPLVPFNELVLKFLTKLSSSLIKHPDARKYPDMVTFGFFLRKANIERIKNRYSHLNSNILGRGVSYHIAPSNVPVNFAYSFATGLLSGNSCIVRVSSKDFDQVNIICQIISELLAISDFNSLKDYIAIIKYPRNREINDYFSAVSDIRVIWGGDETITEIRQSPLPPRGFDITFSDRYSLCLIKADEYLNSNTKRDLANRFYNDTYLFDQNACSSPRLIYWVGENKTVSEAKIQFWDSIDAVLCEKDYHIEPVVSINKYLMSCQVAIDYNDVNIKSVNNLINRIELVELPDDLPAITCAGGLFYEYQSMSEEDLFRVVSRKFQTMTYYGYTTEEISEIMMNNKSNGIDRVVPFGKATDFDLTWDGYDLISCMTREIHIE